MIVHSNRHAPNTAPAQQKSNVDIVTHLDFGALFTYFWWVLSV